jgi:hypothetical protein
MWFAKWFGGRKRKEEELDEPARFAPPPSIQAPRPKNVSLKTPAEKQKGFDPYNSGAFKRHNAWERTNLR